MIFEALTLLLLSLILTSSCLSAFSASSNDVKLWCNQTPYPQPCEYFLSQKPHIDSYNIIKQKFDFLKISIQLALEQAMIAHGDISSSTLIGSKYSKNEREMAAWKDCVQLYDYTVVKLNKILNPNTDNYCTQADVQTWLTSALTNLQTCQDGFIELGGDVSEYFLPFMMSNNNVSKLISNALSLNKVVSNAYVHELANYEGEGEGEGGWIEPHDLKFLQSSSSSLDSQTANLVVSRDGSGNYTSIGSAISAAISDPSRTATERYVIYVKLGIYRENVLIGSDLSNITLLGDGIGKTIITGNKSTGGGSTTFLSATVAVDGDGFIARGITFRNTAGPSNHQAVALRSKSDRSVFYQCSFEGYQDTLYVHSDRQFYRDCDIYGTVDFIFGNAIAVFQNCNIYGRNPPNKVNTITAQGRISPDQNSGISIHNCTVRAASDLKAVQSSVKTYLGRPWKEYSRTVFLETYLDDLIDPAGWMDWKDTNFALNTLYYGEYMNTGPGSSTSHRVKWVGYHIINNSVEASNFTVANFISGKSWLPSTMVPFTSTL